MRILIIKISSMGDIIHTLPALTDAGNALPGIQFDWVVEEDFAEIPRWHPLVKNIIPVALRRWRKKCFSMQTVTEWNAFYQALRSHSYDLIIDAQGLLKSALLALLAKGIRCGLNKQSAREPWVSYFYQRKCNAGKIAELHAIMRSRQLFSEALGYPLVLDVPCYGIDQKQFRKEVEELSPYVVFLHGTTWPTKQWPEEYWIELARSLHHQGLKIKLSWYTEEEKKRVQRIKEGCSIVEIVSPMKLVEMAQLLANACAVIAVDTGLGHLSAALEVPTVSLYGPTDPLLTGALGQSQVHLSAKFSCSPCLRRDCIYAASFTVSRNVTPPCFSTITPADVIKILLPIINK